MLAAADLPVAPQQRLLVVTPLGNGRLSVRWADHGDERVTVVSVLGDRDDFTIDGDIPLFVRADLRHGLRSRASRPGWNLDDALECCWEAES